jgi:hypothetical protein
VADDDGGRCATQTSSARTWLPISRASAALDPEVRQFYGRAFLVPDSGRFVEALRAAITDPAVLAIEHEAGSIDAVSDNADVLTRPQLWRSLRTLYERR